MVQSPEARARDTPLAACRRFRHLFVLSAQPRCPCREILQENSEFPRHGFAEGHFMEKWGARRADDSTTLGSTAIFALCSLDNFFGEEVHG